MSVCVEISIEFVRRIVRCLIELRSVRSLLENCKVSK